MIGRVEGPDDPDEFRDDLLVTLLRPSDETMLAPPGSFERIRRGAARRRRVRAAVGGGLAVAAVAIALPMFLAGNPATTAPAPTLVPPAASVPPHPVPSPTSTVPRTVPSAATPSFSIAASVKGPSPVVPSSTPTSASTPTPTPASTSASTSASTPTPTSTSASASAPAASGSAR